MNNFISWGFNPFIPSDIKLPAEQTSEHRPGYRTRIDHVAVPNTEPLFIRSLLDRGQYHDPDGKAERLGISPALWPMFGLLWPSAVHLAGHVAARKINAGERMLEIGCGLALPSLVAHRRGADITASDCHPLAGSFLTRNLQLNRLPLSLKYRHGQWGDAPDGASVPCAMLTGTYDLILGSDLLYERGMASCLARFIDQHARPEAEVWLVDANRGYRPGFNRAMARHGFAVTDDILLTPRAPKPDGVRPSYRGRLLKYRR